MPTTAANARMTTSDGAWCLLATRCEWRRERDWVVTRRSKPSARRRHVVASWIGDDGDPVVGGARHGGCDVPVHAAVGVEHADQATGRVVVGLGDEDARSASRRSAAARAAGRGPMAPGRRARSSSRAAGTGASVISSVAVGVSPAGGARRVNAEGAGRADARPRLGRRRRSWWTSWSVASGCGCGTARPWRREARRRRSCGSASRCRARGCRRRRRARSRSTTAPPETAPFMGCDQSDGAGRRRDGPQREVGAADEGDASRDGRGRVGGGGLAVLPRDALGPHVDAVQVRARDRPPSRPRRSRRA